jgi:hypothetical protein
MVGLEDGESLSSGCASVVGALGCLDGSGNLGGYFKLVQEHVVRSLHHAPSQFRLLGL